MVTRMETVVTVVDVHESTMVSILITEKKLHDPSHKNPTNSDFLRTSEILHLPSF